MTRRELVWVHDLTGVRVGAIGHGFFDLWTEEKYKLSELLSFEIAANHPKADLLIPDAEFQHRGRAYFLDEVEYLRRGSTATVSVSAPASWYKLGRRKHVGSLVLTTATPGAGLQAILRGTGWIADVYRTPQTNVFSMEAQDLSRLALLRQWEKITGLHLDFDTISKSVALVSTTGNDSGLSFRYGRNITGIRKRRRPPEFTRIFPFGADDLSIAGVNGGVPYVEDLSYYTDQGLTEDEAREHTTEEVWSDSSFLVDTDLLAAANARLAVRAVEGTTYEVDVVDLSEFTGANETRVRTGDTARMFDPELGDDFTPAVVRLRAHWLEPWKNRVELGVATNPLGDGSTAGRPSTAQDWHQFDGPILANYSVRDDGDYTIARVPVRFREGGQAHIGVDVDVVGVGSGVVTIELVDTESTQVIASRSAAYTDGETTNITMTKALPSVEGYRYFKVRATTVASGGPSSALGVNIAADADADSAEFATASLWVMALGAVQETPTETNSITYTYTGAVQTFVVPDNVTQITVEAAGSAGVAGGGSAGRGALIGATFAVVPGTVYDVNVGGNTGNGVDPFPNGGHGGWRAVYNSGAGNGGGSTDIRLQGAAFVDALIIAAGGGGGSQAGAPGGDGRYSQGEDGSGGFTAPTGGTQSAGGAAGVGFGGRNGTAGTQGQGGSGYAGNNFDYPGGGGGGGWFGGGGAGGSFGNAGGGGAGGSSHYDAGEATDVILEDGANTGTGYLSIVWETPIN